MSSKHLVIVGHWFSVGSVFASLFDVVSHINNKKDLDLLDKVDENTTFLFGGGADISPSIYNHPVSTYTGAVSALSSRDEFEVAVFLLGFKSGSSFIGVCRGAQLLCALSGGSLYQHVENHAGRDHLIETKDGTVLSVSSAHHQMMNTEGIVSTLIAWSKDVRSQFHIVERDVILTDVKVEPEVVYFPETKSLAMQYHPEFMPVNSEGYTYARTLVSEFILKEEECTHHI